MDEVFARTYGVELLLAERPTLDGERLLEDLRRHCPGVRPLAPDARSGPLAFLHTNHPVELGDATVAAQTVVLGMDERPESESIEAAIHQTWDYDDAEAAVAGAAGAVLVTDMMASQLAYGQRLDLFHAALRGVLASVPCQAIHWRAAQRIVDPQTWIEGYDSGEPARRFFGGAVNVRMFRISDSEREGEIVMDTLGLGALGLPDLQCHYLDLGPGDVARKLYDLAWYLFVEGDVIEDGHTVEGLEPGSKWRCRHEESLVGPTRVVLDVNPGAPFAAGNRVD